MKWPVWPCDGQQHRISVLRITLLHALLSFLFLSFTSTCEVADMAMWWTAAPDIGPTHHASTCSVFLCFALLSFTSVREVADMAMWWTAAPDIGPAHHASTCSIFLSFRLRALVKWLIWPCGGRQHRISVLRIMLQHALFFFLFLSVTSVGEVADLALWWMAAPDFCPALIMLQLDHMVKWRIFR